MSITRVRAQFDGTWYTLAYDPDTGTYAAQITAPTLPGMYPTEVEAVGSDWTTLEETELEVRAEIVPPVVTITTAPGFYRDPAHPVQFSLRDNAGIDLTTLRIVLDGQTVTGAVTEETEGGYDCTYTPPALADGPHTIVITVQDINKNESAPAELTWTVDTTGPTLAVSWPPEGYNTNQAAITISGLAGDEGAGLAWLKVNGEVVETNPPATADAVALPPLTRGAEDGSFGFSVAVTLTEGINTFVFVAQDTLGNETTLTLHVLLDTIVPTIQRVALRPNMGPGWPELGLSYLLIVDLQPSPEPHAAETVTGTVNGRAITFVQDGQRWTAVVPRRDQVFSVEVFSQDAAGNSDQASAVFPNGLESKLDWSKLDFLNYWDLNRIERNTRFVYAAATSLGHVPPRGRVPRTPVPEETIPVAGHDPVVIPEHEEWLMSDILYQDDVDRLNSNVQALQTILLLYQREWVPLRTGYPMDWRTWQAIEQDLTVVDKFLTYAQKHTSYVWSGQIAAGMWP